MSDEYAGDDEHSNKAEADADIHLLLDDLECLPRQEIEGVRYSFTARKIRHGVACIPDCVHGLYRVRGVWEYLTTHVLVDGLQLRCHLGSLDALLRVGLVHPDDILCKPTARAREPSLQTGIVLGLYGHEAVCIQRDTADCASSASRLEGICPRAEGVAISRHNVVQLSDPCAHCHQTALRGKVVSLNGHDVESCAKAAEVLVVLLNRRQDIRPVWKEAALRVLHRELCRLPSAKDAENDGDQDHCDADSGLHNRRREPVLQALADAAAFVGRWVTTAHLVGVLCPILDRALGLRLLYCWAARETTGEAEATIDPVCVYTLRVERSQSREHRDLEHEEHQHGECRIHAERRECRKC
mmetsp:Transcript_148038/g.369008  ORF Transcript_148038/g.369008 Transcript_148038/m.369008 type:complete len:356 (+) Transcript_148038:789-1856(+)